MQPKISDLVVTDSGHILVILSDLQYNSHHIARYIDSEVMIRLHHSQVLSTLNTRPAFKAKQFVNTLNGCKWQVQSIRLRDSRFYYEIINHLNCHNLVYEDELLPACKQRW